MGQSTIYRAAAAVIFVAGMLYILSVVVSIIGFLSEMLLTVFLAWIIASNIQRLTANVTRVVHVRAGTAMGLSYLIVLLPIVIFLVFIVPVAVGQMVQLATSLPTMVANAPEGLEAIENVAALIGIQVDLRSVFPADSLMEAIDRLGTWMSANALGIAASMLNILVRVLLILILSVYLVADGSRLGKTLQRVIPVKWHDDAEHIYSTMNTIFQGWLRGVLVVSSLFAASTFVLMLLLGMPYAVPIALIAGLILVLPLIGDPIAIFLPALVALQNGSYAAAGILVLALFIIDSIIRNYLFPRLMGKAVNLPVSMVFVSVLLGAQVAGLWGALLGVPIFALIYSTIIAFADRAKSGAAHLQIVTEDTQPQELPRP